MSVTATGDRTGLQYSTIGRYLPLQPAGRNSQEQEEKQRHKIEAMGLSHAT